MDKKKVYAQERERIINLASEQYVSRSLAEEMIQKTAYWYKHQSGHPVHAPNHFKRIYDPVGKRYALSMALSGEKISKPIKSDWKIDFGGNAFLITKAILRCQASLLKFLDNAEAGDVATLVDLKHELKINVRQSVANYNGQEYEGYYSGFDGNHLIFGAQSISTEDFVNVILSKVNVHRIFKSNTSSSSSTNILSINSSPKESQKKTLSPLPSITLSLQEICPYCGAKVKTKKLKVHKTDKCPKRPLL
ncbi:hypothetical protein H6G64_33395 [Calothrix sp. FACHB-156]|nr:hypothetical protein [Calothrix sp. FACHB-156]